MLGTRTGNVHEQRQGTGLATVIRSEDRGIATYTDLWKLEQAQRAKKEADDLARKNAAVVKLKEFNPEFFFLHQNEVQGSIDSHADEGANLIAEGLDPFSSNDPRADKWRRSHAKIAAMSQASKDMEKTWMATRAEIEGDKEAEYLPQDIAAFTEFYEKNSLSDIVSKGLQPPILRKRNADLNAFGEVGKLMKEFNATLNGSVPSEAQVDDFISSAVKEPAVRDKFSQTYAAKFAAMPQAERDALNARAIVNGNEPWEQAAVEDGMRWLQSRKPFQPRDVMAAAAQDVSQGLDVSRRATPGGYTQATSQKDMERGLAASARAMIAQDERWMSYFPDMRKAENETDSDYRNRVAARLAQEMRPLVKTSYETGVTEKGEGEARRRVSFDSWLKDMRSGDATRVKAASQFLMNSKYSDGTAITNVFHKPGDTGVSIEFSLPPRLKDATPDQMATYLQGKGIQPVQASGRYEQNAQTGRYYGYIDLLDQAVANQQMLTMYTEAADQRKVEYDPRVSEFTQPTAAGAGSMIVNPLLTQKRSLDGLFNN